MTGTAQRSTTVPDREHGRPRAIGKEYRLMTRTSGRILKSENVEVEGQYQLDVGRVGISKAGVLAAGTQEVAKQARIIETHPQYAVIEVTCSCGGKTLLRCEYTGAAAPDKHQAQNGTPAVSKQTK